MDDLDEILEFAFEICRFSEDREAIGPGGGVSTCLRDGVHAFADLTDAGRGPFDFRDDAKSALDLQGLAETWRRMLAGEGRQFGIRDRPGERGDFPALGVHDFD